MKLVNQSINRSINQSINDAKVSVKVFSISKPYSLSPADKTVFGFFKSLIYITDSPIWQRSRGTSLNGKAYEIFSEQKDL